MEVNVTKWNEAVSARIGMHPLCATPSRSVRGDLSPVLESENRYKGSQRRNGKERDEGCAVACGVNGGAKTRNGSMKEQTKLQAGTPDGYHTDKWTAGSGSDIAVVQHSKLAREAARSERQNKLSLLAKINFLDTESAVLWQIRVY